MHRRTTTVTAVLAAAALLAAGCSSPDGGVVGPSPTKKPSASAATTPAPSASESAAPATGTAEVAGTLATGLTTPWGVAELPDGAVLVASRDTGKILRVDPATGKTTEVGSVPGVAGGTPGGEGGLLGLAISPAFGSDRLVYAYFTTADDNRIARMLYDPARTAGQQLGAPDTILRGIPSGTNHNGGRIAFGPDKMLYAGTGESGNGPLAQDKKSLGGKILRMTPDGLPAEGNPDPGSVVYSYGHRNVQGLAWDAKGRLWAAEFGQNTWDELNLIEPGRNYGWPVVEGQAHQAGYVDPVVQWPTADASPSGIAYAAGSIWMASLRGERLWRIPLDGTKAAAAPQAFFTGTYGRLRTVVTLEDGTLLLTTSNTDGRGRPKPGDDRILRLTVG
ncbi:PQQ-dependent sugar dehydrogenase [Streptomyces sp. H10-C2]|uniref:PQQ-dependent sugar dehydrogenase n=1 Tax=unclassified Streptomyces TaxID=2593676 RepID=UPI0024B96770|nr:MULTISPECIES: PQQ-dependent sugar dehydrogenase [unclassified Streptomyces]MDJ0341403.1 PQQ-dependent sugar dehydrogenase [Streptomyces sp. PH10-H1]MDJ0369060.1 PQQ-dependent sugar dehydrogenase [Streptomyces sp. H10-C2]